jgi:phosphopantothenoylcysteine synthetase/decarboxylase
MNILLGLSGHAAALRAPTLVQEWARRGHKIRVIVTQEALEFIHPALELGDAEKIYNHNDHLSHELLATSPSGYIACDLASWCDRLIVFPLSAQELSRFATGDAAGLLSSVFLSLTDKPVILYPALNSLLARHPFVHEHLSKLEALPNLFVHPPKMDAQRRPLYTPDDLSDTACVAEVALIANPLQQHHHNRLRKNVLVIIGPENIAPDSNHPSYDSPTVFPLVTRYLSEGHHVTIIAGGNTLPYLEKLLSLPNFILHRETNLQTLVNSTLKLFARSDILVMGSPCEITFDPRRSTHLLKVNPLSWAKRSTDLLTELLKTKKSHQQIVGLADEDDPAGKKERYYFINEEKVDQIPCLDNQSLDRHIFEKTIQ